MTLKLDRILMVILLKL